jgi:glycosyltransferase 2 family protein
VAWGRPSQGAAFGSFLIGNMVNNLLPMRAGDVAKIQILSLRTRLPRAGVAGSVFVVEATLDGIVFLLFLVVAFAFLELEHLPGLTVALVGALAVVAVVVLVMAVLLERRGHRLPLPQRAKAVVAQLQQGLHALGTPVRAAGAVGLSLPSWLLEAGTFWAMGQAFGLDLPFLVYLAAMVAANLAVAIPIGLWNLGPYEVLVSAVLVMAGADEQVAFTYALTTHLAVNIWINLTGLAAFWTMGVRPREIFALRHPQPAGEADAR